MYHEKMRRFMREKEEMCAEKGRKGEETVIVVSAEREDAVRKLHHGASICPISIKFYELIKF